MTPERARYIMLESAAFVGKADAQRGFKPNPILSEPERRRAYLDAHHAAKGD